MAFNSAAKYFLNFQQQNPGFNRTVPMLGVEDLEIVVVKNRFESAERGMALTQSFDDAEISE